MGQVISIGNNSLRLLKEEHEHDPSIGPSITRTYEGSEDAAKIAAFTLGAVGRSRAYQLDGPIWQAQVTIGNLDQGDTGDVAEDSWEIDTEFIQEDFWTSPSIIELCSNDVSPYKRVVEESIDNREDFVQFAQRVSDTYGVAIDVGVANELFTLRNRGDQATEVERKILRRVRTVQINSALRSRIDVTPLIYTTDALTDVLDIPPDTAALLPADPTSTPAYTAWAWKKRQHRLQTIAGTKRWQEILDFSFAAWATAQYSLIV